MSLIEWVMSPAEVCRHVNYLYFFIVLGITLTVLGIALYTKNKRAVKMFLFAIVIWALIEGIGLVTGMREYSQDVAVVYVFVALVEDPGWVCLGYMMAEQMYKRLLKKNTPAKSKTST
ncbi:MAG: hypothetical protein JW771_02125 [Candidatus Thermoplasmatota archaeon]|nr:hypothetical protein [Candidatus Thermoplasmatota archaeon]